MKIAIFTEICKMATFTPEYRIAHPARAPQLGGHLQAPRPRPRAPRGRPPCACSWPPRSRARRACCWRSSAAFMCAPRRGPQGTTPHHGMGSRVTSAMTCSGAQHNLMWWVHESWVVSVYSASGISLNIISAIAGKICRAHRALGICRLCQWRLSSSSSSSFPT